uniref:Putative solute carrier family 37 member 4 of the major facilitator superfamily of transporter n=1 Tax=Ixodes ricinus TaxID=34613 RepID=A0A6B0VCU2_IXORI
MELRSYQLAIFATMFLGYACYAYNRKSVSFALPELMAEGLRKDQAGMIVSSQNLAYAVSKFLGGVLSDRLSARLLFSAGLVLSGLATLLFGACPNSVALFSALWFLNGLAQGCGWPSCAKVLRKWYAPSQFGTWWSVLSASANISGGVAPFLSAFLIVSYGWRFSLTVAGTVSVAMGAVAALAVVDEPSDVGLRVEGVAEDRPAAAGDGKSAATTADLVRSPFLWLVSFGYLVVFCAKTSAVDWGQLYLMEDLGHSQYVGSSLTSSIESGGFFGGILAGYLTDWFLRAGKGRGSGNARMPVAVLFLAGVAAGFHADWFLRAGKGRGSGNARMPVAVLFLAGVAAGFHALCFHVSRDSSELAISCLGLFLGACLYGPIAIFGVAATESAPAHLSGTSHAVAALAASVGAVISGLPFSLLAQNRSWGDVFLLLEVACAATAAILFLGRNLAAGIGRPKTH